MTPFYYCYRTDSTNGSFDSKIFFINVNGEFRAMMWDGSSGGNGSRSVRLNSPKRKTPAKVAQLRRELENERKKVKYDSRFIVATKNLTSGILSAFLGFGIAKVLGGIFLKLPFIPFAFIFAALVIGFTVGSYFIISRYFLPVKRKPQIQERIKLALPKELDRKEFVNKLIEAENKIRQLEGYTIGILEEHRCTLTFKDDIDNIRVLASKLVDELVDKPQYMISARNYVGYYLDATLTILDRYREMAESDNKVEMMKRVDKVLKSVQNAFDKKLSELNKADTTELDIDIRILEDELKQDGHV